MYEQGVQHDINVSCPGFSAISREGTKKPVRARTHKFALKTVLGQTARVYGADAPSTFAVCDQPPEYLDVDLSYKKTYIPYRVNHEVLEEATNEGAMLDVLANDLDDLVEQHTHQLERALFTGDQRDVLFALIGSSETGPDGDGNYTYGVQWYGGHSGEELGDILELLHLTNMTCHASDAVGNAARTTGAADNSFQIVSVDSTLGSETITVTEQIAAYADGDVVYRSRQDTSGVQGATDGFTGLPLLADDWSLADPFQGVDAADAPSFAGQICDNGGVQRDLTEALLETAIAKASVRRGRSRKESMRWTKYAFYTNEKTARRFALQLTADRRFTAPSMIGKQGMKPVAGIDMQFLTYDGIPFVTSQLGMRNSVFLVDLENVVCIHNGAAEGQFLQAPNGPIVERIACAPVFEYVWWAFLDFAIRKRNGMVHIKDLTSLADC